MTLQTIYYSRLQNMEHYQFASRVLQLCNEAKVEKLTAVLGPLAACVADEDRVLNQPRTGADTKALEEADRKRDKSYQSLRLLVALHLNSADKAVLTAAEAVDRVMKAYPDVAASNYDKETGLIKNLVADLRTADLLRHVARLQAQVYINLLDADNKAFDTLFHARVKSGAPAGSFDIKPLRAATDKASTPCSAASMLSTSWSRRPRSLRSSRNTTTWWTTVGHCWPVGPPRTKPAPTNKPRRSAKNSIR
ncbi:DUF6261 family protein [Hoylesella enoeca]|uniref:DUF6261 family protein n=1 Tax=Hoylesella enoeca TaxID=76123 RepID=UPI000A5F010D|nr:DUF6261 family protein [Hoylesella enoeca]